MAISGMSRHSPVMHARKLEADPDGCWDLFLTGNAKLSTVGRSYQAQAIHQTHASLNTAEVLPPSLSWPTCWCRLADVGLLLGRHTLWGRGPK